MNKYYFFNDKDKAIIDLNLIDGVTKMIDFDGTEYMYSLKLQVNKRSIYLRYHSEDVLEKEVMNFLSVFGDVITFDADYKFFYRKDRVAGIKRRDEYLLEVFLDGYTNLISYGTPNKLKNDFNRIREIIKNEK